MEAQPTTQHKNRFGKSLGTGMKSVFNASGRKYFILEHRTHGQKHKAGEVQQIIVDYIELGRDPKCQVRFGDDMTTVSRRHASIAADGDKWLLTHLSRSNPTLVNGRPMTTTHYLQNGDEIQLSPDGPKMGFLVPANNTVKSIGLSKRLSLFRQQALRPYKTAITVLTVVLLLGISGLGYGLWDANQKTVEVLQELARVKISSEQEADSLRRMMAQSEDLRKQLEAKLSTLEGRVKSIGSGYGGGRSSGRGTSMPAPDGFSQLNSGVYRIFLVNLTITYQGQAQRLDVNQPIGSGFLLNDGRFITARHVVEPWMFPSGPEDELMLTTNIYQEIGAQVVAQYRAVSPSGSTITFTNADFAIDRSTDERFKLTLADGGEAMIRVAKLNYTDWARVNTGYSGGLPFDAALSNSLTTRTQLEVLGFPLGMAASAGNPIYGNCIVGADGLQEGVILITARNFEHGNSGGPVFVQKDGKYSVIGIISAGRGDAIGFIVPISAAR
jgi:S1-C subfamily serine protease